MFPPKKGKKGQPKKGMPPKGKKGAKKAPPPMRGAPRPMGPPMLPPAAVRGAAMQAAGAPMRPDTDKDMM